MKTPLSLLMGKTTAVENDTNSMLLPGVPQMLLHLNGNLEDATGGVTLAPQSTVAFVPSPARFGTALTRTSGSANLPVTDSLRSITLVGQTTTIALWAYFTATEGIGVLLYGWSAAGYPGMEFRADTSYPGGAALTVWLFAESTGIPFYAVWPGQSFALDTWHFFTCSFCTSTVDVQRAVTFSWNGNVRANESSYTTALAPITPTGGINLYPTTTRYLDEVAVSSNWFISSDFTPPTLPWRVA